jgi:hypothetical protein
MDCSCGIATNVSARGSEAHRNCEVHGRPVTIVKEGIDWKARALAAEGKLENYQLMASYAKDVVDFWPNMSMRAIRIMIPKMDALKQALGLVK